MTVYDAEIGCMLFDATTQDPLSAEELGLTYEQYEDCVQASLAEQPTGIIRVGDRRVYAQ
jgi:hypothetical protein